MIVNMLDELMKSMSGDITNILTKDLLKILRTNNENISRLSSELDVLKTNISLKILEMRDNSLTDLRVYLTKHDETMADRIIEKMCTENKKIVSELIPRSNEEYYMKYESMLKVFREDLRVINNTELLERRYNDLMKNIENNLVDHLLKSEDRIQTNLYEIKSSGNQNVINQEKMNVELLNYLDKYKNSSNKGHISENHIEMILNELYKSSEIKRTSEDSKSGDFIMYREEGIPILFEIKNYNRNVPSEEVNKFNRDVIENNMCGIMISISSGICNKNNYHIDIMEGGNICLYIHDMNYDSEKIKLGVDILDNLYMKLKENEKDDMSISSELLNLINKEYQIFISKRDNAINLVKESSKKTIQYIEEMELMNLNNYLSSKLKFKNVNVLRCKICERFIGTNAKSLAAHTRKCKVMKVETSPKNENKQNIIIV